MSDPGFVRSCQTYSCRGASPFADGVRSCPLCRRERPRACATFVIIGGTDAEHILIRETLDRAFNSFNYVGRITGQIERFEDGTWSIDDAQHRLPEDAKSPVTDVRNVVADALLAEHIRVRANFPQGVTVPDLARS